MNVVEARNITKVFHPRSARNAVTALSDFSLSVAEGEIFGLLGPNGAGKTTFIKVLLQIVFQSSGEAALLGAPVGDVKTKRRIGYLPENHRYPDYLTGEQVLRYFGRLSGMNKTETATRINELLDIVDMQRWRKTKIRKYSKGMLQRIGLAQALVNDPKLLILDEPTDGVDPIGRKEIRDLLVRLKNEGKTIFVNSHLLSEVEMISDRVAILNKGKLIRLGSVEELTTQRHRYTITIRGDIPPELTLEWEARRTNISIDGETLTAQLTDVAELNRVIDNIRGAGLLITGITAKRQSLEDMFIEVIAGEGQ